MLRKLRYITARAYEARAEAAQTRGDLVEAARLRKGAEEIYQSLGASECQPERAGARHAEGRL